MESKVEYRSSIKLLKGLNIREVATLSQKVLNPSEMTSHVS